MGALCCRQSDIDDSQEPDLHQFQLLSIIGKGVFGKVRIVQHKRTKKQYALKYIDKASCIKQKATQNIISERLLLERIEYSLIVNMRYAFQDDETLFMALDLMLRGDLRYQLEVHKSFPELLVRHYIADIALSLDYLHKRRIVHRDVKPENILLDKKGHAHLGDFNIATQFDANAPLMWSMAGTMAYMAPEMLSRKGYTTAVDWWSLGVVAYELVFGKRPYKARSKEALIQAILQKPLVFPDNVYEIASRECVDLITGLLDKSPFHRLGCSTDGFEKFKTHPWFRGLDWDLLEKKQLTPPFLPDIVKPSKFVDDGLKSYKRPTAVKTSSDSNGPVTEEARHRLQLELEFANFDHTCHQMRDEEESSFFKHHVEQRRNSLRRHYDRLKYRSQGYHEVS